MLQQVAGVLFGIVTMVAPQAAGAVENKYQVTDAEQNACGSDVISLCGDVGQNEDKVLICMKVNRASLSAGCRPVFDEGLRRRGLK